MALNKEQLKQGLVALQRDMLTKTEASPEEYAERLALSYSRLCLQWRGNSSCRYQCKHNRNGSRPSGCYYK